MLKLVKSTTTATTTSENQIKLNLASLPSLRTSSQRKLFATLEVPKCLKKYLKQLKSTKPKENQIKSILASLPSLRTSSERKLSTRGSEMFGKVRETF